MVIHRNEEEKVRLEISKEYTEKHLGLVHTRGVFVLRCICQLACNPMHWQCAWDENEVQQHVLYVFSLHIHCCSSHYSFELDDEFTAMYKG